MPYTDKATVDVMCLFLGINVAVAGNGISKFSFTKFEGAIVQEGWRPSRSLLDCSQLCSLEADCCGLSYNRSGRLCCLIVAEQLSTITGQSQGDPKLYLNERCGRLYQEMASTSTSTTTATPTTPSTRATISSTAKTSSAQSMSTSTATLASTSTSIPTTKSSPKSLPTSTTTSTAKSTSMTTVPSTTSTSTTTTSTTTTTPTKTTPTSTTTTTPTTTTTTQTIKCDAHALVCTASSVYVLTEDSVLHYDDVTMLTTGAGTRSSISSTFSHISGTVLGGYEDSTGTAIHIVADTVVSYSSGNFQFIEESTLADHFGTSIDFQVDATLLVGDTDTVYIFSGEVLYKASGGQVKSVSLDNNGSKNPYKSNNFADRPLSITAACEVSSELHVFISNKRVYTFQEPGDMWYNLGPLIC